MKNKLNILLSGPGLIGRKHISLIQDDSRWNLVAIVAPDHEINKEFTKNLGVSFYTDIDTAIKSEDIDAAIISSPNCFHYEQALSCIKNSIPVLVEKPLTDDLLAAEKLVQEANLAQVPMLVGHHRSYSPLLDVAQSYINSEEFGDLVTVQGSALFFKPAQYFIDGKWRSQAGGGPILINLIHEIGFLRFLCGEIERVFAISSHKQRSFPVEDTVSITFKFINGALGNFLLSDTAASSKSWEMTSGENPAYPFFEDENCYHFSGTRGSLDFPSMKFRCYSSLDKRSWWESFDINTWPVKRVDPLLLQLKHFHDVVSKGTSPKVSVGDGFENMRVIAAISKSIKNEIPVDMK